MLKQLKAHKSIIGIIIGIIIFVLLTFISYKFNTNGLGNHYEIKCGQCGEKIHGEICKACGDSIKDAIIIYDKGVCDNCGYYNKDNELKLCENCSTNLQKTTKEFSQYFMSYQNYVFNIIISKTCLILLVVDILFIFYFLFKKTSIFSSFR